MDRIDEIIRSALSQEEPLRNDELSLREQICDSFRGRNRWLVAYIWFYTLIFSALFFYALYRFFIASELMNAPFWGIILVVVAITVAMGKIWYWLELNKNSIAREIKRLELTITELSQRLDSNGS